MAPTVRSVLINSPLCFVLSKIHKVSVDKIVEILCDCFSSDDVSTAKTQLIEDIKKYQLKVQSTCMRARRDADKRQRQHKEAVDIVTLISTIDSDDELRFLPIYAVDNTDSIPSLKLEDGDMRYFMVKFAKMEDAILCLQETVNRLYNCAYKGMTTSCTAEELALILQKPVVNPGNVTTTGHKPSYLPGAGGQSTAYTTRRYQQQSSNTVHSTRLSTQATQQPSMPSSLVGQPAGGTQAPIVNATNTPTPSTSAVGSFVNTNSESISTVHNTDSVGGVGGVSYQGRWADCQPTTSASSAVDTDDAADGDVGDFTLVLNSRRSKRRRVRRSPGNDGEQPADVAAPSAPPTAPSFAAAAKKPPRKMMVGTLRSPPTTGYERGGAKAAKRIAAAKPLFGMALFCVDNVDKDVTAAELEQFVRDMGVRVLKCKETQPRRTYRQKQDNVVPTDHKAFFLKINNGDTKLLLDPSKWPADISVSPWYFKEKTDHQTTTTTPTNQSTNQSTTAQRTAQRSTTTTTPTTTTNQLTTAQPTAQQIDASAVATPVSNVLTVAADVVREDDATTSPPVAAAGAETESATADEEPMNLSPINNSQLQLHDTNQSDEFDEASETLSNDNSAHNSTSVQIIDLSVVTEH